MMAKTSLKNISRFVSANPQFIYICRTDFIGCFVDIYREIPYQSPKLILTKCQIGVKGAFGYLTDVNFIRNCYIIH